MKIAIDFDGTLVEHKFPKIGEKKLFAFETLHELQKRGDQLILWTYRTGDLLDEAVEFCRQNGIEFYAINRNYPEEVFDETQVSRKIDADIYIDDKGVEFGGEIDWSEICSILKIGTMDDSSANYGKKHKKSFFSKILEK